MKGILLPLAVLQAFATIAQSHGGCGFMPDHFFLDIMNNPNHTEETKQSANFTLHYTNQIRDIRAANNGFDAGDDDQQYPEEESPDDQSTLQQELAQYNEVEDGPADPDSVETPQKRRRGHGRRQSNSLMRFIHNDNMNCDQTKVGPLVRNEQSGVALDSSVNNVFDGFYWTDRLYRGIFGRNSIDNMGERFRARVHHCSRLNNAFWDGIGMFFGDGDGVTTYTGSWAANQDVIGHEVTHGVVERANPLHYFSTTGALNEHLADVFGVLTRQYRQNVRAADDSWLLGENIYTDGSSVRSMKAPGTASGSDNQPAHMANYYYGSDDNYGVHINSGIPNHAFYLFATSVGGNAWSSAAGTIWYNVLNRGQGSFSQYGEDFVSFAQKTLNAAGSLYGPATATLLRQAWQQVGVLN